MALKRATGSGTGSPRAARTGTTPPTPDPAAPSTAADVRFAALEVVGRNSRDLMVVIDSAGSVTYANPAALKVFGISLEEGVGTSSFTYLHPDDVRRVVRRFLQLRRLPRRSLSDAVRAVTPAGDVRELEIISTNFLDDPAVAGIVVNGRDVTDQRAAEWARAEAERRDIETKLGAAAAVARSEERFRLAFADNMAPMVIADLDDRAVALNDAFCAMVGYTQEELLGSDSAVITHPDDAGVSAESRGLILTGPSRDTRYVKRYIHKSGRVVVVEASRTAALDADGNPLYFVISERDVTDRVQRDHVLRLLSAVNRLALTRERRNRIRPAALLGPRRDGRLRAGLDRHRLGERQRRRRRGVLRRGLRLPDPRRRWVVGNRGERDRPHEHGPGHRRLPGRRRPGARGPDRHLAGALGELRAGVVGRDPRPVRDAPRRAHRLLARAPRVRRDRCRRARGGRARGGVRRRPRPLGPRDRARARRGHGGDGGARRRRARPHRVRAALPAGLRGQHGPDGLHGRRGPGPRRQRRLLRDGRLLARGADGRGLAPVHLRRRRGHHRGDRSTPALGRRRPGPLREALPAQGRTGHRLGGLALRGARRGRPHPLLRRLRARRDRCPRPDRPAPATRPCTTRSPAWRTGCSSTTASPKPTPASSARAASTRCSSSTWTTSRASTTPTATSSATSSSPRSRAASSS